ncbi:MAG TPA: hypothetical protein VFU82_00210 [Gammaproteobacteria bacterium]|nr:hypothetical protein [Gammaproteobacteria bacterium]
MTNTLPLFYFKPTLCWIDDDQLFLDAVSLHYAPEFHSLTFTNSFEAVEALNQYQSPLNTVQFTRELTESDLYGTQEHHPISMNIPAIKSLMQSEEKHKEIAILVSDYNMPGQTGLEVLAQLKPLPCQKILLTGDASHDSVVKAFNDGLIQRFIQKNNDTADILRKYVFDLVERHFQEKSRPLMNHLESSKPSALSDPIFINAFNQWREKENIVEFYLINKQGCFIAKNNDGDILHFVVFSEQDKKDFLALHDEAPEDASSLLKSFEEGVHIPFFGVDVESWDIPHAEWEQYFYPAQVLQGRDVYYWAVV